MVDPGWERYVGRYRSAWSDLQVLVLDGQLVALDPSEADPNPAKHLLHPLADHTFRIETKDGYSDNGELAMFQLDAQGNVIRAKFGDNTVEPVSEW